VLALWRRQMRNLIRFLPVLALSTGSIYAGASFAQGQMQGHTTSPPGAVPTTGSEQGANSHNSEPMKRGMQMRSGAATRGPMVTSPPGVLPETGSAQGANSHNSDPMPSGMKMRRGPQGPMLGSGGNPVPQTGSAQGAESPGSMPPGHMAADPNKKP
jgi:hypothetical protein